VERKKKDDPQHSDPKPTVEKSKPTALASSTPSSHTTTHPPTAPPTDAHGHRNRGSSDEDGHHNGKPNSTVFNPPKQLIALYTYDATEDNELSFVEGETLHLLEKDDSGWWRGRNVKGQEGLFPSNFVEVVGEEGSGGNVDINKDYQALYDYEAEDETELTIKEGEILHVIYEKDGWYFGSNAQGQEGSFPSNFVEPVQPQ